MTSAAVPLRAAVRGCWLAPTAATALSRPVPGRWCDGTPQARSVGGGSWTTQTRSIYAPSTSGIAVTPAQTSPYDW